MVLYTQIKGKPDQKTIDKQSIKTTNKIQAAICSQQKQPTKTINKKPNTIKNHPENSPETPTG